MTPLQEQSFRAQATQDNITHISTGIAVIKDEKILIVRRAAGDYLGGQYELPGGGVDDGESIYEAAIRETKEETGLTVVNILSFLNGFDYSTDKKPRVRQINFLVEAADGEVILNPLEHDEYCWVDRTSYDAVVMTDNMKRCLSECFDAVQLL